MTNQKEERKAVLGRRAGRTLLGSALFALIGALLIGGVVLLSASFVFSRVPRLASYIGSVGAGLGALTAFFGGLMAGKRHKHAGALAGLLFGALFLLALLLLGRLYGGASSAVSRLIGYTVFLLLATLGGALGTVELKRGHKRRKRR